MNLHDYMSALPIELQIALQAQLSSPDVEDQMPVKDKDLTAPPASPVTAARYIIAAPATGLWTGKATYIAEWSGSAWVFTAPIEGMICWVEDENLLYAFNGTAWVPNPLVAHALVGSAHTVSGLTPGHALRATGATTVAFGQVLHSNLGSITATDHHSNANDPTSNEKAALVGTSGTPSSTNKLVTDADPRVSRASAPELDRLDVAGGAAIAAAGGDIELVGRNLLQSQTFDSITLTETAASVSLYALKPGDSGITVEIVAGAGVLSVTYAAGALVITLAVGGSTDDAIATEINANAAQTNGYVRAVSASGGSFTAAQAAAPMTGGVGDYTNNKVMVAGLEALPANETGITSTAKWSGTGIACTTQAVGAATDVAAIVVQSNGLWTQQICGVMA